MDWDGKIPLFACMYNYIHELHTFLHGIRTGNVSYNSIRMPL
jgi:hypothetical protein